MAKIAGGVALLSAVVFLLAIAVSPSLRARCFPTDLAAGRPWTVPNSQDGYPSSGNGPSSAGNTLFHTTSLDSPSVEIQLDGEHVIRKIVVVNRADCCQERALPLNVEILGSAGWKLIAQRRAAFSTWEYDVEPVRASVIRVRRPGSGYFHLKRISVYGQ
jgi:hypothetical protein